MVVLQSNLLKFLHLLILLVLVHLVEYLKLTFILIALKNGVI